MSGQTSYGKTDDAHDRLEQEYNLAALLLNSARVPLALDGRQLPMVDRIAWLLSRERRLRNALQKISKHEPMARSEAEGFRACQDIATKALGTEDADDVDSADVVEAYRHLSPEDRAAAFEQISVITDTGSP